MNLQIDPSVLSKNAVSQSTIKKMEHAEKKSSFTEDLAEKIDSSKRDRPKDKELWNTCVEFESIFVSKLFSEMRKTVHKGGLIHGGRAEEIFEDFLYDEYAKITSQNSNIGIAKMVYEQLS